jgi:hypothetical protein
MVLLAMNLKGGCCAVSPSPSPFLVVFSMSDLRMVCCAGCWLVGVVETRIGVRWRSRSRSRRRGRGWRRVWLTMMVVFHSATLLWSYSSALPMAVSQAWVRQQLHLCWLYSWWWPTLLAMRCSSSVGSGEDACAGESVGDWQRERDAATATDSHSECLCVGMRVAGSGKRVAGVGVACVWRLAVAAKRDMFTCVVSGLACSVWPARSAKVRAPATPASPSRPPAGPTGPDSPNG